MAGEAIAIVAGVGSGTGASVARRFATAYPVVLLARNPSSYEKLAEEINSSGGKAIGISTDLASPDSVKQAFQTIEEQFKDAPVAAAIFNASGPFVRKPILEIGVDDLSKALDVSVKGAFVFSQHALPGLVKHAKDSSAKHPPALIYTGATASVKANAFMSAFTTPKFALRALATSIAKEYGPQGVHVSHAIIDGAIDIDRMKEYLKNHPAEASINPNDIAEAYWNLHTQTRRGFTFEIDIRPSLEKW